MSFQQPNLSGNKIRAAARDEQLIEDATARQMIDEAFPDRGVVNRVKRLLKRRDNTVDAGANPGDDKYPPLPGL